MNNLNLKLFEKLGQASCLSKDQTHPIDRSADINIVLFDEIT